MRKVLVRSKLWVSPFYAHKIKCFWYFKSQTSYNCCICYSIVTLYHATKLKLELCVKLLYIMMQTFDHICKAEFYPESNLKDLPHLKSVSMCSHISNNLIRCIRYLCVLLLLIQWRQRARRRHRRELRLRRLWLLHVVI